MDRKQALDDIDGSLDLARIYMAVDAYQTAARVLTEAAEQLTTLADARSKALLTPENVT